MRRRGPPDKVQRARIRVLHDLVGCDVGIERPERMDVAGGVTPRRSRLVFAMLDMGGGTSNNYAAEGGKECESEWVGGVGNSRITELRGVPLNSTATAGPLACHCGDTISHKQQLLIIICRGGGEC